MVLFSNTKGTKSTKNLNPLCPNFVIFVFFVFILAAGALDYWSALMMLSAPTIGTWHVKFSQT